VAARTGAKVLYDLLVNRGADVHAANKVRKVYGCLHNLRCEFKLL
jgi:hypothetical protein